jgi:uncharacterized protein (TIGR00730 family)
MAEIRSVCVFCGSSVGVRPEYAEAAHVLGESLARRGLELVYGGSNTGLMKVIADACLAAGGRVIGVIPQAMVEKEVAHWGLTELHVVSSMHERKAMMADRADAFAALPGGFGTIEEFFEILTWAQLGLHSKPCALINTAGYFDPLLRIADHALAEAFLRPEHRAALLAVASPAEVFNAFASYQPPDTPKWIGRAES